MSRKDAESDLKRQGYTICFSIGDKHLYRQPGVELDADSFPIRYAALYRVKRSWKIEYIG